MKRLRARRNNYLQAILTIYREFFCLGSSAENSMQAFILSVRYFSEALRKSSKDFKPWSFEMKPKNVWELLDSIKVKEGVHNL